MYCRAPAQAQAGLNTPLGFLASQIHIDRSNGLIYFWNRRNARLLLAIREGRTDQFDRDLNSALTASQCTLEGVFNDLIGFTSYRPHCTREVFHAVGTLLTGIAGIGTQPTGLLNLNGLIVYSRDLPTNIRIVSSPWGINELYDIESLPILLQAIGASSKLLGASSTTNNQFIFHDGITPILTCSGLLIGPLIGDKTILAQIPNAVDALLAVLSPAEQRKLLTALLTTIAVDDPLATVIVDLFRGRGGN